MQKLKQVNRNWLPREEQTAVEQCPQLPNMQTFQKETRINDIQGYLQV